MASAASVDSSEEEDVVSFENSSQQSSEYSDKWKFKKRRGPQKTHPVWEYFKLENGQSQCALCSYTVKGSYTTTLLNHLMTKHPKEHRNVASKKLKEEEKKAMKEEKVQSGQMKLAFPVVNASPYENASKEKKHIDEALARFAGTTSFPYHLIENEEFVLFCRCLNPRYKTPSRETLKMMVNKEVAKLRLNIKELISGAKKVSICADIWTQKNMVAAYLGVTAHFYCDKTSSLENVCLAVMHMSSSHTADRIKALTDEIVKEYDISEDKISRYRTDNGSNMVAAFRESMIEISAKLIDSDFSETTDMVDANLDESFDEFADYEDLATEFKRVFPKLLDCTAHSLQLPLRKIIYSDTKLTSVRSEVFTLLSKFSKSEIATRLLKEKCGKKLILPGATRWNSLCLTYERLLEIRESVDEVCIERHWATLGETYGITEAVCDLLKPFLTFTDFLQGEQYATISSTIPSILNLLIDPESPEPFNRWQLLGDVPSLLAVELRKRFQHIIGFQEQQVSFDATYLVSTFLDPNTSYLLSPNEQKLAKRELLIMTYKNRSSDEPSIVEKTTEKNLQSCSSNPFVNRFSRLAKASAANHLNVGEKSILAKSDDEEVDMYMKQYATQLPNAEINAVEFWKSHREEFPHLSTLAFEILSIPATSAAVERGFSQAGLATGGRKCQTGPSLLELECMMKYNKKYF